MLPTIYELRSKMFVPPVVDADRIKSATWVMTQVGRHGKPFTETLGRMHQSGTNFNDLCLMIRGAMFSGPDSMEPVWRARYEIVKRQWQECVS